ncbi:hypothetical protein GCM10009865_00620 [Aeromicrobium ponti]|uniref:Uncharacterized protein DUF3231 n=1 Tax=Cytobacillus oceanisediminis TaxID=665099 RepID=A0A562JA52_9BACI|nr:uncharacterized protein DUF3231 [Cytobacillus oceanisediminis]
MPENHVKMTSGEIGVLWTGYQNDSMSLQLLSYFLATSEDSEIRPIIEFARHLSEEHLKFLMDLFQKEDFPVPVGFTSKDANLKAPKLYTDAFMLEFILQMAKSG